MATTSVRRDTVRRLGSTALTTLTWVLALAAVFPFLWMLIQALQPEALRFASPPTVDPGSFNLDGFRAATRDGEILVWLRNSAIVAVTSTLISLVLGSGAAYAIARFRTRAVTATTLLILASQMVPPVVLMVPLFSLVTAFGLFDTLTAVVLGNIVFTLPVVTWMLSASVRTVPPELEEAAMVDGCGRVNVLRRITIPVALPGVAAAAAFSFTWAWQEFLFARIIVSRNDNWVGGVGIASFFGVYETPWHVIMAATVIFTIPPVIFFLIAQRRFVDSVGGAVKG
ncbi:carbohydrate ABC transporter permease [Plantactinospora sp. GCM10030261]|uniref:carbohydrate ABC transporter permease n=1 Tax=Plantactinospora sp. GCM10030261 TaxID=3273420 RepID=UPI00360B3FCC